MYCTLFCRQKRIVYRGLALILFIGLLLQVCGWLPVQEMWHEAVMYELPGWRWVRRRRRCWRYRDVCIYLVARRGVVLLLRMSLMAGLLVWSGWVRRWPVSWVVLSLPIIDVGGSLLPLWWPGVLKRPDYAYLLRGAHALYRLAVIVLWCEGVRAHTGGPYGVVIVASGGVREADGAWARGEIEADGTWCLEMEGHFIFRYKPRNFFEERIILTRLSLKFCCIHELSTPHIWG
jgi:hypothetical protein